MTNSECLIEVEECAAADDLIGSAESIFNNQLEPTSLIDSFVRHPPDRFEILNCAASRAPAFAAPFHLLTTADESLRRRFSALPFYRQWSGVLQPRVAFVGTTVSEYVLLPSDEDVRGLPVLWKSAWASRFPLLIIKDIPQRSSLLSELENRRADELVLACEAQGYFVLEGQALAYVTVDFADVSTFLDRLSSSRRKNLRRKMRSLDQLELTQVPTGDARFADERLIDEYFALYLSVFAQSEIQFDQLSRDFLASLLRDPRRGGLVFEYRRRGAFERLVGWNLCFVTGGKLVDKYIGLSYPAARELNLYFVSWMVNLEFAAKAGLSHYVAGWTDPEVKAQLGAKFTFTRHAVYTRHKLLRAVGRRLSKRLAIDRDRVPQCP
ncbi:MAG: GNAT family N-acetyltransferase [Caldimonas sp.]